ncbi:MAG TPA: mechanosensitive ion channel family protein, partial [Vicinamibacterales bacterium]|nr:mechanosensitive ion channel family protein [Vicinamibacterales bacterium]
AGGAPRSEVETDAFGRDTPRGTLFGFMAAASKGNIDAASIYLNTSQRDRDVPALTHQLYVVLDARLPARLREPSDRPEGSLANPIKPNQDIVGSIATGDGSLDIVVERVNRGGHRVWLFSRQTLDAIPAVYDEADLVPVDRFLPGFLTTRSILGIRLFNWLDLALLPLVYRALGLLGLPFGGVVAVWRRRQGYPPAVRTLVPGPVRLLLLAVVIRWGITRVELPLVERQFWATLGAMLVTAAFVWVALVVNEYGERRLARRFRGPRLAETAGTLRLARRAADVIVVAIGVIFLLRVFGIDPTAALAGLGIGGIAVALSAQKTLENVIGGLSIIMDQAVRVGDFMKLGDIMGTVDFIGLRSTRIRTLDRTILTVPNGQLASVNVETLSVRDKYWFHHFVGLGYETTAAQMRKVVDDIRGYLAAHPTLDRTETLRVRFFRFGPFSLDVEIFAYVIAADWEQFLETQQEMMIEMMAIVERTGAAIALPSQRLHVVNPSGSRTALVAHQND